MSLFPRIRLNLLKTSEIKIPISIWPHLILIPFLPMFLYRKLLTLLLINYLVKRKSTKVFPKINLENCYLWQSRIHFSFSMVLTMSNLMVSPWDHHLDPQLRTYFCVIGRKSGLKNVLNSSNLSTIIDTWMTHFFFSSQKIK